MRTILSGRVRCYTKGKMQFYSSMFLLVQHHAQHEWQETWPWDLLVINWTSWNMNSVLMLEVQTLALGPGLPTGPRSPFAPIKPWRQTQRDVGGQICSTCIQGSKYHRRSVKEIVGCHCAFHGRYTARILPTIGLITHLIETDTGLVSN